MFGVRSGALAAALLVLLAIAAPSAADEAGELDPDGVSFWEWLEEPYAIEIEVVLLKSRANIEQSRAYVMRESIGLQSNAARNRKRLLDDAEGMLRYGLRLVPDHPELLLELGRVTDDNGKLKTAREAYENYLAVADPDLVNSEAHFRLGRIYAREARWEDAISRLRLALGKQQGDYVQQTLTIFTLASVYMEAGQIADAIDLLVHAVENPRLSMWSGNHTLQFALAVAYDRDEQETMAHRALERIIAGNQKQNLTQVLLDPTSQRLRFTPAVDRHYFTALQYEALGNMEEARAEWVAYASFGDLARFRERALEHVATIDRMRTSGNRQPAGPTGAPTP